jgi:hypothetical protein
LAMAVTVKGIAAVGVQGSGRPQQSPLKRSLPLTTL